MGCGEEALIVVAMASTDPVFINTRHAFFLAQKPGNLPTMLSDASTGRDELALHIDSLVVCWQACAGGDSTSTKTFLITARRPCHIAQLVPGISTGHMRSFRILHLPTVVVEAWS